MCCMLTIFLIKFLSVFATLVLTIVSITMHVQTVSPFVPVLSAFNLSFTPTPQSFPLFPPNRTCQNSSSFGFKVNHNFGVFNSLERVSKLPFILRERGKLLRVQCKSEVGQNDDSVYMRRCVQLAQKAIGFTSPNPMVGCVIVKEGKVVGEGFHPKAGQPHAEVFALRDAGEKAENATLYVSLEPCNHYGRTPPCTEALIKAKLKKVVVGMVDPNPIVASKGINRLREAGIDAIVGVEEDLCRRLNEAYIHKMVTGNPFITVRYSLSVNGNSLHQLGEGFAESNEYYSQLLQEYDAVIFSSSLLNEKQSILPFREPGAKQPVQFILSKSPTSLTIVPFLTDEMIAELKGTEAATTSIMAHPRVETVTLDNVNLNSILEYCKRQSLCSVLLDLRGNFDDLEELVKEGIDRHLFNKVLVEMLPIWSTGDVADPFVTLKKGKPGLKIVNLQLRNLGRSVLIEGYFK